VQSWHPLVEPWTSCDAAEAASWLSGRPGLAWLDSSLRWPRLGRWSIVASDPRWTLTASTRGVVLADAGGSHRLRPGAINALVRAVELEQVSLAPRLALPDALPFVGGAIGYLGFELGREVERLPATTLDDVGAPDLAGPLVSDSLWHATPRRGMICGPRVEAARNHSRRRARPSPRPSRWNTP
jgi:para-aminobenzoate synthetase component 1